MFKTTLAGIKIKSQSKQGRPNRRGGLLEVSKEYVGFYFMGHWLISAFILERSCGLSFVSFLI